MLNCTKIPLILLYWKSPQSTLWVDFKIESVLQASRKKIKFCIYITSYWRNGSSYSWLLITQIPKRDKVIIRIKHKFVQGNERSSYQMWFFISFAQKRPVRCMISGMSLTRVCMEFNLLNMQIIKSQLCLWISNFFPLKFK